MILVNNVGRHSVVDSEMISKNAKVWKLLFGQILPIFDIFGGKIQILKNIFSYVTVILGFKVRILG